jgi:hypothetical protein
MAIETIRTLVPDAVDTPRGAVWAATAAAWIVRVVRDLTRRPKPRRVSAFTRLARLRTQWAMGGRCIDLR